MNSKRYALSRGTLIAALLLAFLFGPAAAAEDWALKGKDGAHYSLSGLHGKWVLVNFWAPWCPPCLEEMPGFDALQKHHHDLQVIGVAVMYHSRQQVLDVVNDKKIAYPIVLGNEDIASDFGSMTGMPTSFLYTPEGRLAGRHEGPLTQDDVERAMNGDSAAFTP